METEWKWVGIAASTHSVSIVYTIYTPLGPSLSSLVGRLPLPVETSFCQSVVLLFKCGEVVECEVVFILISMDPQWRGRSLTSPYAEKMGQTIDPFVSLANQSVHYHVAIYN